jgi:hypothetical protein
MRSTHPHAPATAAERAWGRVAGVQRWLPDWRCVCACVCPGVCICLCSGRAAEGREGRKKKKIVAMTPVLAESAAGRDAARSGYLPPTAYRVRFASLVCRGRAQRRKHTLAALVVWPSPLPLDIVAVAVAAATH